MPQSRSLPLSHFYYDFSQTLLLPPHSLSFIDASPSLFVSRVRLDNHLKSHAFSSWICYQKARSSKWISPLILFPGLRGFCCSFSSLKCLQLAFAFRDVVCSLVLCLLSDCVLKARSNSLCGSLFTINFCYRR